MLANRSKGKPQKVFNKAPGFMISRRIFQIGKCHRGMSSIPATSHITKDEVLELQSKWAGAIKGISKAYLEKGDYIGLAGAAAGELYGYGHSNVHFKPTKATKVPFRPTPNEAMSYFVGGGVVEGGYDEDAGFAINGGKGWKEVVFKNHQIDLNGPVAIAMGEYVFVLPRQVTKQQ